MKELYAEIKDVAEAPKNPSLPWQYAAVEVKLPDEWTQADLDYSGRQAQVFVAGGLVRLRIRRLVCEKCGTGISKYQYERLMGKCRGCA